MPKGKECIGKETADDLSISSYNYPPHIWTSFH